MKLRERYDWGPSKIAGHLSHKGLIIDHNQAHQIICEAGLNHPITAPRKIWGTRRFQRDIATAFGRLISSFAATIIG